MFRRLLKYTLFPYTTLFRSQLNGLGVTPLQIVDDQQTWAVASHDGSAYSVEQPMALSHVAGLFRSSWLGNVDRKSTRLNSSHLVISYAVFCLKKKKKETHND